MSIPNVAGTLKILPLLTLVQLMLGGVLLNTANAQEYRIYVSDAGNFDKPPWQILSYDQEGADEKVFISDSLAWPQDILFLEDQNEVLISNLNSGKINVHHAETGEFMRTFASGIGGPTRMKVGPDSLLYVLQWGGDHKVLHYALDGTPRGAFTEVGIPQSIGLDWDKDSNLYVASFFLREIQRFSDAGEMMAVHIDSTQLAGPTNVWFNQKGQLLVADYRGGSVKIFGADGRFISLFADGLQATEGIDFLPDGSYLLGNGGDATVKLFKADGQFVKDLIPSGKGGLKTPNAVRIREIHRKD